MMSTAPSTKTSLHIRALGQFQVTLNGKPLSFKMRKIYGLLVYLIMEGDKVHNRSRLAGLLWPEQGERKARENLRQALYQLRREFGDQIASFFTITRTTVQFHHDSDYWLDAEQFQAHAREEAWEKAATLYNGEFLGGSQLDESVLLAEWILMARERLHQLALQTFLQLAQQAEAAQQNDVAATYANRLLALEPWSETGHRILMRLAAGRGRRSKALAQYERCKQILANELGVTPSEKTLTLYKEIRHGRFSPAAAAPAVHNLPVPLTPLVGRDDELAALGDQLAQPTCRLITITGHGGLGKTRLLLALGRAMQRRDRFRDGVFLVSLLDVKTGGAPCSPTEIETSITGAILNALPISRPDKETKDPVQALIAYLRQRQILLLLDNWDTLLAGAALVGRLLAAAPQLNIVATSREPLRVQGEHQFPLARLSTPSPTASSDQIGSFTAVQLFMQCARRVRPNFQLTPDNDQSIAAICRRLGGHPLAIQMAAAWLRGLTLAEVAEGLSAGLDFLTATNRDISPRHQNIRLVFAHSWAQLTPAQQRITAQLSLFRRSFTGDAARAVTGAALTDLAALVTHSWLKRTRDGRYQFHELLRQFAEEKLAVQATLYDESKQKYIRYHLSYLKQQEPKLLRDRTGRVLDDLRRRRADIEQAWRWTVEGENLSCLVEWAQSLAHFYRDMGLLEKGISLLETAGEQIRPLLTPDRVTPPAQRAMASLLIQQARLRNAQVTCQPVPSAMDEATTLAKALYDPLLLLEAHIQRGAALYRLGRLAAARRTLQEALTMARRQGSQKKEAVILGVLGNIAADDGRFAEAEPYQRTAMTLYQQLTLPVQAAHMRHNLALTLTHMGRYSIARRLHQENLALWRQHRSLQDLAITREGLGNVSLQQGQYRLARLHLGAGLRLYREIEDLDGVAYTHMYLGQVAIATGQVSQAAGHYRKMVQTRRVLGHDHLLNQGWAGLAEVAWRRNRVEEAVAWVEKALPDVLLGRVQGEGPFRVYLICYQVLAALGDERATAVLEQAVSQLQTQADKLGDANVRRTFLYAVSSHRALLEAAGGRSRPDRLLHGHCTKRGTCATQLGINCAGNMAIVQ